MRLDFLHDKTRNFIVRVCPRVSEMDGSLVDRERSVVRDCEECDEAVWYDTKQVIPPIPEDMSPPPEREVLLCLQCMVLHVAEDEGPEVKWLKPVPERADRHE